MSKNNGEKSHWYRDDAAAVLDAIDSSNDGLSEDEAKSRLEAHGPNTIRSETKTSAWKVLLHQFKSPLIYVLIAALIITALIQRWDDVIVIALVLVINAVIGFTQEYRAESAVQSLMEMVSPKAKVRRGGKEREIDSEELVPGDVVRIAQGDMTPADLRIIDARGLQIDESAMTGESVPVPKTSEAMADVDENPPPADQMNMAFMGTAVTAGRAQGVIVAPAMTRNWARLPEECATPVRAGRRYRSEWIAWPDGLRERF